MTAVEKETCKLCGGFENCFECVGRGHVERTEEVSCGECGDEGVCPVCEGEDPDCPNSGDCEGCGGSGMIQQETDETCEPCEGTGKCPGCCHED